MSFGSFGVTVNTITQPPSKATPTDTGTLFLAAPVGGGAVGAAFTLYSINDFVAGWGDRTVAGNAATYDYLDTFFREGGRKVVFAGYTTATHPTDYEGALAALADPRLGPGQIAVAGAPASTAMATDLQTAATGGNRFALRDVPAATGTVGTDVTAYVTAGGYAPAADQYGATFGPWVTVPGPSGISGVGQRSVPASAAIAALCQRVDEAGNPNRAAGGRDFPFQYVVGFATNLTSAQQAQLQAAYVNPLMNIYGVLENYGFETNVPPDPGNPFWQANCSRARMWMKAQAQAIGENYYMKQIDGQGRLAASLRGDLSAMLKTLHDRNGLYGRNPSDAYQVTVNDTINNATTASYATLRAVVEARLSLHARTVQIDLVSVPVANAITS